VVFELSVLVLGFPVCVGLAVVMFEPLQLVSLLVGPSFELSELMCFNRMSLAEIGKQVQLTISYASVQRILDINGMH
jgi:hypothetical protein